MLKWKSLMIIVCLTGLGLGIPFLTKAAPIVPQGSYVYEEDFTTYDGKDYTDPTVAWDIFSHTLSLAPMSGRYQNNPEAAPDHHGGIYVVWEEIRADDKNWDIYIQRLDEQGNRLWADDVRVQQEHAYGQMKPAISVDPEGNAVVVWHDDREWPVNGNPSGVFAQKISPAGERMWAEDVKVNVTAHLMEWAMRQLAVATDGDGNAFVVWQGARSGKPDMDVYAQKLDSTGQPLWTSDVQVNGDATTTAQRVPHVAVDDLGQATVVWVDGRHQGEDIYAQRVDGTGNRLWAEDVAVSDGTGIPHQGDVSVALDSQGQAVVVWQYGPRRDITGAGRIYAQKLATTGEKLWSNNVQVNQETGASSCDWPSVAVTSGDNIVVVWQSFILDDKPYMQRLNTEGVPIWETDRALLSKRLDRSYIGRLNLDVADRGYLVWSEWPLSGSNDVFLQQIDVSTGDSLWPGYAVRVEKGEGHTATIYPDVVTHANGEATVVWGDLRRGDWAVYGTRIDASGQHVWPKSYLVNRDPTNQGWMPAIARHTSGDPVVAWVGRDGVKAQCIDAEGNRQWPTDVTIKSSGGWYHYPDLVATPDGTFYAVWIEQCTPDQELWDIRAHYFDGDGNLLWGTDQRVNQQDYTVPEDWVVRPFEPEATVDNEGHLVVAWYGNSTDGSDIFAQRVSPRGERTWTEDLALGASLPDIAEGGGVLWSTNTAVGISAQETIVAVWVDDRNGDLDLYAQRVDKSGTKLGNTWRVNDDGGTTDQRSPVLSRTSDGGFIVAWTDFRNGPSEVFAQRFTDAGALVWPTNVKVSQTPGIWATEANISHQPLGHFYVAWRTTAFGGHESAYLQRLNEDGTVAWDVDLNLTTGEYYAYPEGSARSATLDTVSKDIVQATLTSDMEVNGGEVQFYLTNDGGAHWAPVTPGVSHVFTTTGSDLRWKVNLETSPSWVDNAPVIHQVRVEYSIDIGLGDDYEPDDACASAAPLQVNGAVQRHTFSHADDTDWAWFDVFSEVTYVLQTSHTSPGADTILELYDSCDHAVMTDTNDFGNDARLVFTAPADATFYARVSNHDGQIYGEDVEYDLSVRTYHPDGLAVIVAGHNDSWELQSNIDYAADRAYLTLLNAGYPKANIHYLGPDPSRDVDGLGSGDDIAATATLTHVQHAIEVWPREQEIASGVPLFIYLMDHGHYDIFLADGNDSQVTAAMLDLWLSNLESTTGADQITVIIDACKSGSFIDINSVGPHEISAPNRVVVASTTSQYNSFPSTHGSTFSDNFWTALGDNHDLWSAYQTAKAAVEARGLMQMPWLDDNGDALANDDDGALARGRGLAGVFGGSEPVIDWLQVGDFGAEGQTDISAQVRDDFGLGRVYVEIFPPGYQPPEVELGGTPDVDVPTKTLTFVGNDVYTASLAGLIEPGIYRIVAYAVDDEENQALPKAVEVLSGSQVYLPLVMKQ